MKSEASVLLGRGLQTALHSLKPEILFRESGTIKALSSGVVTIEGLTSIRPNELIALPSNGFAIAANISTKSTGAILLSDDSTLKVGMRAYRTRNRVDTPVGNGLLGRVVTPLGKPLDGLGPIQSTTRWPIERPAPAIIDRSPVRRPLQTGLKAVDAAIPIGRGQRELILGDRQTGKTSVALDTILNQKDDVLSVYCAIGQRQSAVARAIETLRKGGALHRCIVVVASGEDPPGLRYLAPFSATSIAEYFMESGRDALIIYDDLTKHARSYRELSLLLRRPPGREAYPGDIFYLHARLLERATQLKSERGGGSMTALPIIETQGQNISAYIPTNLISITDGQIYLSPELFEKGILPAVDIGRSVSRVGGKAQLAAYRSVVSDLKLYYAQFEELEIFARFGTRLDAATQTRLNRGRCVREILKQDESSPINVREQIAVLLATTSGLLDAMPIERLASAEIILKRAVSTESNVAWAEFNPETAISKEQKVALLAELKESLSQKLEHELPTGVSDGNA